VIDPRTPVVVGVGQTSQRVAPGEASSPIDLLVESARTAERDAGRPLLARADVVAVVNIVSWPYPDPGAFLARKLGIEPAATMVTTVGGNSPQLLVDELAAAITRGDCDVALIGGAEAMHTRWRARRDPPVELRWDDGGDPPCARVVGDDRPGTSPYEEAHLAAAPAMVYPLFETALRAAAGESVEAHRVRVSELWARFSAVAAENPAAWTPRARTAEEIRTVGPDNRMIVAPYPKLMCSNIDVDQSAALILCSYEAATRAGVADDRMVFLHGAAEAHDHWFTTERASLTRSPAIAAVTRDALAAAGLGTGDLAYLDLYSCFPAAVQIARRELGLAADDPRPLTVTGGLGFAGGPVNNYPTHAIARMVEALRADPGSFGLTTALGWYVTKHAAAVWSTVPPRHPFATRHPQAEVDAGPRREVAGLIDGEAVIEATAVAHERDGEPSVAIVSLLLDDGRRALANARDRDVLRSMTDEAWEGRRVAVGNDGTTNSLR